MDSTELTALIEFLDTAGFDVVTLSNSQGAPTYPGAPGMMTTPVAGAKTCTFVVTKRT